MLNQLSKSIHRDNRAQGFWDQERNIGEMLMLIVSELGEALEAHRRGRLVESPPVVPHGEVAFKLFFEDQVKDSFQDEIADALIRILDLCGGLDIDIEYFIEQKLRYNRSRKRLHGKEY
jgi:NTP pyrophosphatase (non-canonical NTP hydrolase)